MLLLVFDGFFVCVNLLRLLSLRVYVVMAFFCHLLYSGSVMHMVMSARAQDNTHCLLLVDSRNAFLNARPSDIYWVSGHAGPTQLCIAFAKRCFLRQITSFWKARKISIWPSIWRITYGIGIIVVLVVFQRSNLFFAPNSKLSRRKRYTSRKKTRKLKWNITT